MHNFLQAKRFTTIIQFIMIINMKLYKISLALMLGFGTLTSCSEKLELTNPNDPTTGSFGNTADDLEDAVIACYHHTRMEGTYARVGYTLECCRGDEVWNVAQSWNHISADNLNVSIDASDFAWIWRDWYYVINISNFVITKCGDDNSVLSEKMKRIKGQALFIRGLAYYNLANFYQNPAIILDYNSYSTLEGLYAANHEEGVTDPTVQYDLVLDQVESDFADAMELLPTKDLGGEWAKGRATKGAAAGFYARALMQRHKYSEALAVLKEIIAGTYGKYELMKNYGDNFREGSAYENNAESLYEVQFLDYGSQGSDDEWTPVNISKNASQGHALEANFAPAHVGSWQDLAAAPWLYFLFKNGERTKDGKLDPRLYWTIGTYEDDWETYSDGLGNMCYTEKMADDGSVVVSATNKGLPVAKYTNFRTGLYSSVVTGLKCGINIRIMRYSDVLLRAAECENEVHQGPTDDAIKWVNMVRSRANLADLNKDDFDFHKFFEQIANVERPKEFGCEAGRCYDLIRWGFFYDNDRLQQLKEHGAYKLGADIKEEIIYGAAGVASTFDKYAKGHEYFPIYQNYMNINSNLVGNSANLNSDNSEYFKKKGWKVHPVVDLSK